MDEHPYRTLVGDTLNGAEQLCHRFICDRDFDGDWGNKGFASYKTGYEVALPEWTRFLNALDKLRVEKKMTIMWLCHTKVKPFKNPTGADYDRYQPDVHEKTWSLSHKWADCVLFGNFEVSVKTDKADSKKGKATGGNYRMMYTQRDAAWDAKNRLGLPEEIEMGSSPQEAWKNFMEAIKQGKELPKAQEVTQ